MIGSRAVGLLKTISASPANRKALTVLRQQIRYSSDDWCYRSIKPAPKWSQRGGTLCAAFCWWWIYWNLFHGWPHIIGLYDGEFLPDPRKQFTDEELGIPSDVL